MIRIPEGEGDQAVMRLVESLPRRFSETGLRISTGPVVAFRATEYLLSDTTATNAVPLLHPHNVKPFAVRWPLAKAGKPGAIKRCPRIGAAADSDPKLRADQAIQLQGRKTTVDCRLFAKGGFPVPGTLASKITSTTSIIAERELTEDEVYGIAAIFNSSLIDRYFRTISGNTQVNATEIRAMNFPEMKLVAKIGKQIRQDTANAEAVVLRELGVAGPLHRCLVET